MTYFTSDLMDVFKSQPVVTCGHTEPITIFIPCPIEIHTERHSSLW